MAKGSTTEVSEYELQRQANIAKNQALLKELQLSAASAGLAPKKKAASKPTPGESRPQKKKPAVKKESAEPVVRRTSSRLRGLVADSEVAKRKAEEEHEALRQVEKAKRQRVSGDLNLSDIIVAGRQWDNSGNFLRDLVRGKPYERTFTSEDVKETTDKDLKALRQRMSGLELYGEFTQSRIKLTPERIYCMGFHPMPDKPLVFAGDKMGNLGLFDGSQSAPEIKAEQNDDAEEDADEDEPEPAVTTFKPHTRTISSMQVHPTDSNLLFTASYDSSIRKLDLAKGAAVQIWAPSSEDEDEPVSSISIPHQDPHLIYFSSLEGRFGRHDTRAPSDNTGGTELWQLSDKKIGGFSLHPLQPHLVATASLDRMMKLWDLRKITGSKNWRHPLLVGEHESRLSVSHAAFSSSGHVATSSYDDTIKIHDFTAAADWKVGTSLSDDEMEPMAIVPHNNQTGRWVTILRPQWQERPQDGHQRFCIGNMSRFVDIYSSSGAQLAQLGGDDITAVPAVTQFHPTNDWVAGGTASGKLCLWM
ncbi:WD repeat-containing protein [Xylona heveae TC161]|uniref:DNA damage-binding protein CMR1 n=1 Tax=Xylona heveae (strain CBS 132557 / TC161) TaxID=1328760 RepID=A0A165G827_XYLHT|nr:WD repeat-containing protein [Xylona heveae TC161]KZF21851.1 WD repeat-containing protein [Xylona heveae TC161]